MTDSEIQNLTDKRHNEAFQIIIALGIVEILESAGCRVNLIGSLKMGLLARHRDIDFHVYSSGITTTSSFAMMAALAENPAITEIKCINGLHTDEHCISWHLAYLTDNKETWHIDIIHIEEKSPYDGFFENMAARIAETMTPNQRATILRLKWETPENEQIHGVEYYEAVISGGITTLPELRKWIQAHRKREPYYWIP